MNQIKLNVGASPRWYKEGWAVLDHKIKSSSNSTRLVFAGTAQHMDIPDESVQTIFCSHMFEHIPQVQLPEVLNEFYRVLQPGGLVRILTPNLRRLAEAYVSNDTAFWAEALAEDENIRTDLGLGGSLLNFIISPGQDTALFSRDLSTFISGYAHVACYDFEMLSILFKNSGFSDIEEKQFCVSNYVEFTEPLHIDGFPPVWENLNKKFYDKNGLIHFYDDKTKQYKINFTLTGFDRDPLTSLIIECKKPLERKKIDREEKNGHNYERYGKSLLGDPVFLHRLQSLKNIIEQDK